MNYMNYISLNTKNIYFSINKVAQKIDLLYYNNGDFMDYIVNLATDGFRPHKHNKYEIIAYMRGTGTLFVAGREIEIKPRKIVIIPPYTEHYSVKNEEIFERIYINGDFEHIFKFNSIAEISDNNQNEGLNLIKMIYDNRFSNHE